MSFKSFFSVLAATLLLFIISNSTVKAQNPLICSGCSPTLSAITIIPTLDDCTIAFQVTSGMNLSCRRVSYDWTTTDPNGTVTFAGEQALVTFKSTGTFQVCVTFTVGTDVNGDGTISLAEQCSVTECIDVSVDCE